MRLQKKGVEQVWAGSFEALLCRDVSGVNARLAAACREHGPDFLIPFGCVNPRSPDWEEDLRRCHEEHRMAGIRLYPNYHGYSLEEPAFARLLSMAASRNMIVQIALSMEDTRTQFPLMLVQPVNPGPLAKLLSQLPQLKVVLLNAGYWATDDSSEIGEIRNARNAYFDIAMNEGIDGLDRLVSATSAARVVFGSHYPFFYFESALLKVKSADLSRDQERAIFEGNARLLLAPHD
ncbi:MAG: amidohydrolase family protein [Terracidiphilus sp.]